MRVKTGRVCWGSLRSCTTCRRCPTGTSLTAYVAGPRHSSTGRWNSRRGGRKNHRGRTGSSCHHGVRGGAAGYVGGRTGGRRYSSAPGRARPGSQDVGPIRASRRVRRGDPVEGRSGDSRSRGPSVERERYAWLCGCRHGHSRAGKSRGALARWLLHRPP